MTFSAAFQIRLQSLLGRAVVWVLAPAYFLLIRIAGWRVRDLAGTRKRWAELRKGHPGPWLVCGNHLTMVDSMIMTYAMTSLGRHLTAYRSLPWNLPERTNFNRNKLLASLCYLAKCIPVRRGGAREEMRGALEKCDHLLRRRQNLMVFPEGGRSRTGRVNREDFSYGVGRFLQDHPDCRVACVYLRGDGQDAYGTLPRRGESFSVMLEEFRLCRNGLRGLREQRDLAGQIVRHLAGMEERHFDLHRQRYCGLEPSGKPGKKQGPSLRFPCLHP